MAKLKIENKVWHILKDAIKIYFTHIGQLTKYMLFPVFGQILGIILIFTPTVWFTLSITSLIEKFSILNNIMAVFLVVLLISLPGFVVFIKAFWDFMVAYGALNSMASAVISTGKLYDLKAHTQVITKRSFKYILLLCLISLLGLVGINPLFWIISLIFFIYFILVFQVFTLEEDTSITGCFKRSLTLVKGNFGRTFVILAILFIITYYILNTGVSVLFEVSKVSNILRGIFESFANTLPLEDINITLAYYHLPEITALKVANEILASTILFMVTGLTLPLRSICWTLWYKNLSSKKVEK